MMTGRSVTSEQLRQYEADFIRDGGRIVEGRNVIDGKLLTVDERRQYLDRAKQNDPWCRVMLEYPLGADGWLDKGAAYLELRMDPGIPLRPPRGAGKR